MERNKDGMKQVESRRKQAPFSTDNEKKITITIEIMVKKKFPQPKRCKLFYFNRKTKGNVLQFAHC